MTQSEQIEQESRSRRLPGPVRRQPSPSRQLLGRFVTLGSVAAMLRRRRRIWVSIAAAGFLIGLAGAVAVPGKYAATVTLYLEHNPADNPTLDMANDVGLLQSYAVSGAAATALKLPETAQTFLGQYTSVAESDAVLEITVTAPSSADAVARANTLAAVFLTVRTNLFNAQNASVVQALTVQAGQITKALDALPGASGGSTADQAEASNDINLISNLQATISTDNSTTATIVTESKVLTGAVPLHASKVKKYGTDAATGLIAGLALGCGFFTFEAVLFEKLRRRDDIAKALGAPVAVTVPLPALPRLFALGRLNDLLGHPPRALRRLGRYVRDSLPASVPSRLALVAVDRVDISALALAEAARLLSEEGRNVLVADLSRGGTLAQILGLQEPGTSVRLGEGADSALVVWPDDEAEAFEATMASLDGADSPDVYLCLVTLDPAQGAGHVATWASDALAIITAGRTKESTALADGEMLQSAGIALRSVAVVGVEPDDESLGHLEQPEATPAHAAT